MCRWTGGLITLTLDEVRDVSLERACEESSLGEDLLTMVVLALEGELGGVLLLAFDEENGRQLAATLLRRPPQEGPWSELEKSALTETGNILGCAYLGALARLVGCEFAPLAALLSPGLRPERAPAGPGRPGRGVRRGPALPDRLPPPADLLELAPVVHSCRRPARGHGKRPDCDEKRLMSSSGSSKTLRSKSSAWARSWSGGARPACRSFSVPASAWRCVRWE